MTHCPGKLISGTFFPALLNLALAFTAGPLKADASLTLEEVVANYYSMYKPVEVSDPRWNGVLKLCRPGSLDSDFLEGYLDRWNYLRLLAGVPAIAFRGESANTLAQRAALMMAAADDLRRNFSALDDCYSATGEELLGRSVIGSTPRNRAPRLLDLAMDESDPTLADRRWSLYSRLDETSMGLAVSDSEKAYIALEVIVEGPVVDVSNGVPWPAAGYFPYDLLPEQGRVWSFSHPFADFGQASVTMSVDGAPVEVQGVADLPVGYGEPTLAWSPAPGAFEYGPAAVGSTIDVVINNVAIGSIQEPFEYQIKVIDPQSALPWPRFLFTDNFEFCEPDPHADSAPGATDLGDLDDTGQVVTVSGNIFPSGDADWFRFRAVDTTGGQYEYSPRVRLLQNPRSAHSFSVALGSYQNIVYTSPPGFLDLPAEYVELEPSRARDDTKDIFVKIETNNGAPVCDAYLLAIDNGLN